MKLLLFLDDYLIDSKQDVYRVFPAAQLEKTFANYSATSGITHYNAATKQYEAWESFDGDGVLATSEDGENWTSTRIPQKLTIVGDLPGGCSKATRYTARSGGRTTVASPLSR